MSNSFLRPLKFFVPWRWRRISSETAVFTRSTWRYVPEDSIPHSHCREDLKSYTADSLFRFCLNVTNGWTLIASRNVLPHWNQANCLLGTAGMTHSVAWGWHVSAFIRGTWRTPPTPWPRFVGRTLAVVITIWFRVSSPSTMRQYQGSKIKYSVSQNYVNIPGLFFSSR
jgi:hypothetical protein